MTTYLRLPDIFTQMSYCHSHQTSFHPSIPGSIYPSAQVRMLVTAFDSSITHSVTKSWPFHFLHASLFPCTYSVQAILCHWMCYISLTLSSCFRSFPLQILYPPCRQKWSSKHKSNPPTPLIETSHSVHCSQHIIHVPERGSGQPWCLASAYLLSHNSSLLLSLCTPATQSYWSFRMRSVVSVWEPYSSSLLLPSVFSFVSIHLCLFSIDNMKYENFLIFLVYV